MQAAARVARGAAAAAAAGGVVSLGGDYVGRSIAPAANMGSPIYKQFTVTSACTVKQIKVRAGNSATPLAAGTVIGIYNDAHTTLLGSGTVGVAPGVGNWATVTLGTPVTLAPGTNYRLYVGGDGAESVGGGVGSPSPVGKVSATIYIDIASTTYTGYFIPFELLG